MLSANSHCGIDYDSLEITVYPEPNVSFTAPDVCEGIPTQFTNNSYAEIAGQRTYTCYDQNGNITSTFTVQVPAGGTLDIYSWNFGDPASGSNNTSTLEDPTHVFSSCGTYTVTLTVTDSNGCSNEYSTTVEVFDLPESIFTVLDVCSDTASTIIDSSVPGSDCRTTFWFSRTVLPC